MWPLNFLQDKLAKYLNWVLIWVKENSASMHSEESASMHSEESFTYLICPVENDNNDHYTY